MNRKLSVRLAAIAAAIMLAVSLAPAGAGARTDGGTVGLTGIVVSYGNARDGGFPVAPVALKVSAGVSEKYGYEDNYAGGEVTALDALVGAHEMVYGTYLTEVLKVSGGSVSAMFGDTSGMYLFFVNGVLPEKDGVMCTMGEAVLAEGDIVEFFTLSDSSGTDGYAWFEDEAGSRTIEAVAGEPVTLVLKGTYLPMWGNRLVSPFDGTGVMTLSFENHGPYESAWMAGYLGMTDGRGRLTVTFTGPALTAFPLWTRTRSTATPCCRFFAP